MSISEDKIQQLINEMTSQFTGAKSNVTPAQISTPDNILDATNKCGDYGIFDDVEDAIAAAKTAFSQFRECTMERRAEFIAVMREAALANCEKFSKMANEETGYGRVSDKIAKNKLAATKTPGTEVLVPTAFTGDYGLTLVECAPYGVVGAITPSTNPTSTVINNAIGMVAAGNATVFNAHPAAKNATAEAIKDLNKAIMSVGGPANLLTAVKTPTLESGKTIMTHKDIKLLVITGGEAVVEVAMKSGKKCISAGPGNPPVIVDDTANVVQAAKDIVAGASFDNNVLCIAEKEVFAFDSIADELMREMVRCGAYKADMYETKRIMETVLQKNKEDKYVPNRAFVGKCASEILKASGIDVREDYKVIITEAELDCPLVMTEMLMPVLPIVRVRNLEEAIAKSVIAENGCHHTAIMHSENVYNLTEAARILDTTIFVKNAPSYAGLGFHGEGYTTLTISTPTGEGLTNAKSFTRSRRCTLYGSFRIV